MSVPLKPTQNAVLWVNVPLNLPQGQEGPVSTYRTGLSLTAGEMGFHTGVNTYVLQLRKQVPVFQSIVGFVFAVREASP